MSEVEFPPHSVRIYVVEPSEEYPEGAIGAKCGNAEGQYGLLLTPAQMKMMGIVVQPGEATDG